MAVLFVPGEMNLHLHVGFHLHGILERPSRHGNRFLSQHCGIALRIGFLIDAVPIQVGAEVQVLAVELREGRRGLHWETYDLIGHELSFKGSAGFRAIIDDADAIAAIETIRRAMVAWIGIVIHGDGHSLDGFRADDRGHVGEKFMFDRLQRSFSDLAAIVPFVSDLIGKIVGGLGNDAGDLPLAKGADQGTQLSSRAVPTMTARRYPGFFSGMRGTSTG